MLQQPNKLEMSLLKFIVARFKSKSPKEYALLAKYCGILAAIMASYIVAYNAAPAALIHTAIFGIIDQVCVVVGTILSTLGLGAAYTTTDPNLVHPEVKNAIIQNAVDLGTHTAVNKSVI